MTIHNSEIAATFSQVADLLEIEGANSFRVRAYRNAARLIAGLSKNVAELLMEVDILEDGSLDLPDDILKELDLTICSVHYKFDLPAIKQTERIIRAMDNPYFNILAHPTGRLINKRAAYQINNAIEVQ